MTANPSGLSRWVYTILAQLSPPSRAPAARFASPIWATSYQNSPNLALLRQATAAKVLDASCNRREEGVRLPELLGDPSQ